MRDMAITAIRRRRTMSLAGVAAGVLAAACGALTPALPDADEGASWLAGDHHSHSRYSVRWAPAPDPATRESTRSR